MKIIGTYDRKKGAYLFPFDKQKEMKEWAKEHNMNFILYIGRWMIKGEPQTLTMFRMKFGI